ncbi:hypothetical protein L9F63_008675, partial [Diploptera punctata]
DNLSKDITIPTPLTVSSKIRIPNSSSHPIIAQTCNFLVVFIKFVNTNRFEGVSFSPLSHRRLLQCYVKLTPCP